MGLEGIGVWQLLIVLAICVMVFGTKKLRNMGSDIGSAVKSFRSAMNEEEKSDDHAEKSVPQEPAPISSDQQKQEHKQ